ncbi:MAG: hypothetical protein AAFP90_00905, partial [Planctomycetota bacterium]
ESSSQFGVGTCDSTVSCVLNPHSAAQRISFTQTGSPPHSSEEPDAINLYASAAIDSKRSGVTLDVVGGGFAITRAGQGGASGADSGKSSGGIWAMFARDESRKPIVANRSLMQNEFMDVALSEKTGAVKGVYSGARRGNRLSLQLAHFQQPQTKSKSADLPKSAGYSLMQCDKIRVLHNDATVGVVHVKGRIVRPVDGSDTDKERTPEPSDIIAATVDLRYILTRGSRWLRLQGSITPNIELGDDPWQSYFCIRAGFASEIIDTYSLSGNKRARSSSRRLLSPLGVIIADEERRTSISAHGMAAFRDRGAKRFDTLIGVGGQTRHDFCVDFGMDLPRPIPAAIARIVPPSIVAMDAASIDDDNPASGWLVHLSAPSVLLTTLRHEPTDKHPERYAAYLVETGGKSVQCRLSLFREITSAWRPLPHLHHDRNSDKTETLEIADGAAVVPMVGHQVCKVYFTL